MKKRRKRIRKPYRIKRKKSIFQNRFLKPSILILFILTTLFYVVCFLNFFQIKQIKISGNQKVVKENLETTVQNLIEKKILSFLSKSIFLVNSDQVKKQILIAFPLISSIDFKKELPDSLILEIEERKRVAVFVQNDKSFFIDKQGVIFEEIPETECKRFELRNLILNESSALGDKVIDTDKISQIFNIKSDLGSSLGIMIDEVLIVSEQRFNFTTAEGWDIYFNPQNSTDWQIIKLKEVLEQEIPNENRGLLEYIELRFGNFAPYKYR